MVSDAAAERFLATPLLGELDAASRQAVLNVLVEDRAEAGATLLGQGQPNDHIAFMIEGTASVSRTRPGKPPEMLTTLEAPVVFGLTSFFRPIPPGFTVRADSPVWLLTFDHHAHTLLRRVDLRAAEQLAVAALRLLADRFDLLDDRLSSYIDGQPKGSPKATEWAKFRARLFEESSP